MVLERQMKTTQIELNLKGAEVQALKGKLWQGQKKKAIIKKYVYV